VLIEMQLVVPDRSAFDAGRLATGEPQLAGFRDGNRTAVSGVDAGTHIDCDLGVVGVGVLLAGEGLKVPVAELINIIDDPGFTGFPAPGLPMRVCGQTSSTPIISSYFSPCITVCDQHGRDISGIFPVIATVSYKSVMGFRQFLLRGLDKVRGEWSLVTMAWNFKRMFVLSRG
jgi:hypothetical protein